MRPLFFLEPDLAEGLVVLLPPLDEGDFLRMDF